MSILYLLEVPVSKKKFEVKTTMESIAKIGGVLGLQVPSEDVDSPLATRLRRIAEKVKLHAGEQGFMEEVLAAEQAVNEEGGRALMMALAQCQHIEAPVEKVYKIARVAKGQRINVLSPSGIRFSFGPRWNESVAAGKGIALHENNREKLNMHGSHLGVSNPEKLSARELCAAIAACMED